MFFFGTSSHRRPTRSRQTRTRLWVEALESRLVPYSVSGSLWPHPNLITLSFVPDGTIVGSNNNGFVYSNLFASFNGHSGWTTATWQNQILKAAQVWAQQTNINFAVVSDNGAALGSGNDQQGDPSYGDIRISGYNFGSQALAVAELPPQVNNYSIAGDIAFNTGQPFNIGSTYDLYTVAMHEMGHALGLYESNTTAAVMYPTYVSAKSGLNSDDISGIRNIYSNNGPRTADTDSGNTSFATAANLSAQISSTSLTAAVNNLDVTTTSTADYYTLTAPANSTSTLVVQVKSSGLSMLAPTLTVYAANQTTVLGSASGANHYGTTLSVTVNGISPGQQYYVKVAGADTTAFGTGAYALTLDLGTGASPTTSAPNTTTANGSPISAGGGQAQNGTTVNSLVGSLGSLLGSIPLVGALVNPILGLTGILGLNGGVWDAESLSDDDGPSAPPPSATVTPPVVAVVVPQPASVGPRGGAIPQSLGAIPILPAVPVTGTIFAAIAPPVLAPAPQQPLDGRPGNRPDSTPLRTATNEQPAPLLPLGDEAAPAPTPQLAPAPEADSEDRGSGDKWNEACDACFADRLPVVIAGSGQHAPATVAQATEELSSPEAAVTALALVLGGYWSRPPEETEKRRPEIK